MHRLNVNRELIAGLVFAAFGIAGLWIAADYPRGTALRMGPGYMPMMLSWGLVLLGAVIAIRGLLRAGAGLDRLAPAPAHPGAARHSGVCAV